MFVQLILGRTGDPAGVRRQWDRWHRELSTGADGWLGSTGGATGDGRLGMAVRFASPEAARANSARPEQDEWWKATAALLDGEPTFLETTDITAAHEGRPDDARFVQLMRARVRDRQRLEAAEARIGPLLLELRPDVLGAYRLWFPDGTMAALDYFTSEEDARAGEAEDMPDELREGFGEWMAQLEGTEWYDLTDPWIERP